MCLTTYAPGQTGSELIHNIGKDLRILSVLTSSNPYIYLIWLILFLLLICPLLYRYLKRGVQFTPVEGSLLRYSRRIGGGIILGKVGKEKPWNYTTTRLSLCCKNVLQYFKGDIHYEQYEMASKKFRYNKQNHLELHFLIIKLTLYESSQS